MTRPPPSAISILAVLALDEQVAAVVEDPTLLQLFARQERELRVEVDRLRSAVRDVVYRARGKGVTESLMARVLSELQEIVGIDVAS